MFSSDNTNSTSSSTSLSSLVQELSHAYESRAGQKDPLQFAADFFCEKLRQERLSHQSVLASSASHAGPTNSAKPPLSARRLAPAGGLELPLRNGNANGFSMDLQPHPSPFSEQGPTSSPFGDGSLNAQRRATMAAIAESQQPRMVSNGNTLEQTAGSGIGAGVGEQYNPFLSFSFETPGTDAVGRESQMQDTSPFDEGGDTLGQLGGFNGNAGRAGGPSGPPGTGTANQDELVIPAYALGRRTSVSAESLVPNAYSRGPSHVNGSGSGAAAAAAADYSESTPTSHNAHSDPPKTASQLERIRQSITNNFLFRNLDEDQERDVLAAMKEVHVQPGEIVIQQGTAGDFFYVVESGEFDIFVKKGGDEQQSSEQLGDRYGNKVVTVTPGGSFGELALMYNAPRAATVIAKGASTLWALDRISFRTILLDHTSRKRRMYETFLASVDILSSLEGYERAKIADALESRSYAPGQVVIQEGEQGDEFYLIENGVATVEKGGSQIAEMSKGDYFGELALINRAPRAATVRAAAIDGNKLRVATLGEKAFTRLLGPVREIMARTAGERYGSPVGHFSS